MPLTRPVSARASAGYSDSAHSRESGNPALPGARKSWVPRWGLRGRAEEKSHLDLAVEALDPGRALLVDLLPVLEHELVLHVGVILRQHLGDLATHLHLGVGRHDQIRAL